MQAFVIQLLVPHLWQGACVIWDNCTIHKGEEIEKALIKAGVRVIYLPFYSPDFNPIENFGLNSKILFVLLVRELLLLETKQSPRHLVTSV